MEGVQGGFTSRFVTSSDGLKLHARLYGQPVSGRLPVLCLPGLSRNAGDFDVLARALAAERQVVALDYRGRGLSDRDPNWQNYALPVELNDLLAVTTVLGMERAVFLGTSRGGLLTMLTTAARPTLIAGAILNDIGPVIDGAGLARIKSYLGRLPGPANWDEAVALLKTISQSRFPALTDEDWRRQAGSIWMERDGRLDAAFDPALAKTLEAVNFDQPLPTSGHSSTGWVPCRSWSSAGPIPTSCRRAPSPPWRRGDRTSTSSPCRGRATRRCSLMRRRSPHPGLRAARCDAA